MTLEAVRVSRVAEEGSTVPHWGEGPWRSILPGEDVKPEHQRIMPNGGVSVPARIYGSGNTTEQAMTDPTTVAKNLHPANSTQPRLSKGASRLVNEATGLGLNPTPYIDRAQRERHGGRLPVKGPLVELQAIVRGQFHAQDLRR